MPYDSEANYSRLSPSEVAEARRSSLAATVDLRDGGQQRWHEEVDDEIRMVEFRNARPLQHEKGKSFSLNGNTKVAKPDRSSRVSTEEPNLDNPFVLFETVEELDAGVELLASKHGLSPEVDGLKRAAHFEMDEMDALNDPTFPENEKTALQNEREATFWQQTRDFRSAVLIVGGLSGICQGWTQSILNGTNVPLEQAFNLDVDRGSTNTGDHFTYGALSACVALSSGVVGLFVSDPIQNHWLGRRGAIASSAIISMGATIGAVCSRTIPQIIGCRMLIGAALGAKASVIAPFLAELAPVHMRGAVLSTWQISDALGIFLGDIAWRVLGEFEMSPDTRWRILSATTLIPTVPLIIASCMIPESWMFLMKTREYSKATEAACLYRNNPIQGYRDVISSHFQMEAEGELIKIRKAAKTRKTKSGCDEENVPAGGAVSDETRPLSERLINGPPGLCSKSQTASSKDEQLSKCSHSYHMSEANFFKRMWLVMDDPRCRHALVSGGVVMLTQALCGINAFAFFSSSLLEAGLNPHESLKLALCFGGVSFGFGLLTPFLSDRLGRTTLALLGLPIMAIFMFILASLFALGNSAKTPSIIAFTLLFTAVYSFTLGPAAFSLSAESFPSTVREVGMAMCVFINMTSLGVQLLVYPAITGPIGFTASLCIYGCVDILGFIACFLFCLDTKDRTLEQLQFSFDLPLSVHCEYRLFYVLPEVTRKCLRFMRGSARIEARPDISDDGSMNSGTEAEGNLIPFYRWARIQDPDRPSVYQQLLSVFRKAPHVEQVASKAKQSTSGRVSATTQLAGEKLE